MKILDNLGLEETDPNLRHAMYEMLTANIIMNREKLKQSSWSQEWDRVVQYPLIFSITFEELARAIKQEKKIKEIQTWKEKTKLSIFADDIIH